jgi:hypothetical protein
MKFNFDKEVLIKHHYWLVAVGALVISLAAIFLLRTSVRGAIVSEKEKLDKSLATIKTASEKPVRSKDSINQKKTQAEESKGLEVVVWKKNYMKQEPYVRWAPEVEDTYHFTRDPQTGVIGYFASQVNILEDAAPAAEDPPASDGDVFKGKVKDRDESKVTVEGKVRRPLPAATGKDEEKKDPGFEDVNETRTFFDTPLNKVEIGGKRTVFAKLREGQRVSVTYYRGRYFQDPLQLHERTKFSENYYTQFNRILSRVDPMYIDEDGKLKGVVQLRDGAGFWSYKKVSEDEMPPPTGKFIRYVDKAMWNPVQDFSELAWIAQEDVWIMDEMYRVVDQANAYVREFVPAKEATPVHWIGDNAYWRAEIKRVDADNIHVTLQISCRAANRLASVCSSGSRTPRSRASF